VSDAANNPHLATATQTAGPEPGPEGVVVVVIHGRAQDPAYVRQYIVDRLSAPHVGVADVGIREVTFVMPAADGGTWYPQSFLAPSEDNEPYLTWALERLDVLAAELVSIGVPDRRVIWAGFSQGGCLVSEWVARHPGRWGGLAAFTGALIGPPDRDRHHAGDLAGTPVFLGTSDVDEWVPEARVHETAEALRAQGGAVELRVYPGMAHEINDDEISALQSMIDAVRRA
jgi:phospholipase/carboxylesterase